MIARFAFKNTREGNGSDFLKFVLSNDAKFGFEHIAIECANEESASFAQKFGCRYLGRKHNWCAPVSDIKTAVYKGP